MTHAEHRTWRRTWARQKTPHDGGLGHTRDPHVWTLEGSRLGARHPGRLKVTESLREPTGGGERKMDGAEGLLAREGSKKIGTLGSFIGVFCDIEKLLFPSLDCSLSADVTSMRWCYTNGF